MARAISSLGLIAAPEVGVPVLAVSALVFAITGGTLDFLDMFGGSDQPTLTRKEKQMPGPVLTYLNGTDEAVTEKNSVNTTSNQPQLEIPDPDYYQTDPQIITPFAVCLGLLGGCECWERNRLCSRSD